ncbi:50S ribosomal protein L6 [Marinimicrobium agarilyticum]|uniref:50S ribosomal protein L6 n=1 Tax=Marinimicrobium agarilyticum TaxID=306546 RepID=UPI000480BC1E|nr:50S ribosomal protein L6 [Marinimicrobium agarilyticum]
MSRVANSPVEVPSAVSITLKGQNLTVKGGKGTLALEIHDNVEVKQEENLLKFSARDGAKQSRALAGTMRALAGSMVHGVDQGFEEKLQLVGVGYRAKASGKTVNLSVGYSQPVDYTLPEGVTAETPTQTEIVLKSADKQLLGQVASEIRALRQPEPYKGKGIRYAAEQVRRKEAKKK